MEKGRREGNRRSGRDRAQRRNGGDRECQVLRMNNRVDVFRRNVSPEINAHGIFYNGAPGWVAVSDFFFFTSHVRPELSRGTARLLVKCQVAMRTGILFFKEGTSNDSATVPSSTLRFFDSSRFVKTFGFFAVATRIELRGRKEIGKKIRYTGHGISIHRSHRYSLSSCTFSCLSRLSFCSFVLGCGKWSIYETI